MQTFQSALQEAFDVNPPVLLFKLPAAHNQTFSSPAAYFPLMND